MEDTACGEARRHSRCALCHLQALARRHCQLRAFSARAEPATSAPDRRAGAAARRRSSYCGPGVEEGSEYHLVFPAAHHDGGKMRARKGAALILVLHDFPPSDVVDRGLAERCRTLHFHRVIFPFQALGSENISLSRRKRCQGVAHCACQIEPGAAARRKRLARRPRACVSRVSQRWSVGLACCAAELRVSERTEEQTPAAVEICDQALLLEVAPPSQARFPRHAHSVVLLSRHTPPWPAPAPSSPPHRWSATWSATRWSARWSATLWSARSPWSATGGQRVLPYRFTSD